MRYARSAPALLVFSTIVAAVIGADARAAAPKVFHLAIEHHAFVPDILTIPAGEIVKLMVNTKDNIPAEFESNDFHREVVIPSHIELPVYVGPLKPGTYGFFNDFHPQTKGTLIVKPSGP